MTIVIANKEHACDILGLEIKYTGDMLRKAYLRQALKYHPDKPGGNKEKFQEIRQAFDYLNENDLHNKPEGRFDTKIEMLLKNLSSVYSTTDSFLSRRFGRSKRDGLEFELTCNQRSRIL